MYHDCGATLLFFKRRDCVFCKLVCYFAVCACFMCFCLLVCFSDFFVVEWDIILTFRKANLILSLFSSDWVFIHHKRLLSQILVTVSFTGLKINLRLK